MIKKSLVASIVRFVKKKKKYRVILKKNMDEDQKWENNSLSDNLTTNNNYNSQSDKTERKITQTDHLNKQLLNAFLERLNTTQITETSDGDKTQQDQGELTEVEWCEEPEKTINVNNQHIFAYININSNSNIYCL